MQHGSRQQIHFPLPPSAQKQSVERVPTAISMQHPDLSGTFPEGAGSNAQRPSARIVKIKLDEVSLGHCQPLVICGSCAPEELEGAECRHS